jgi:predicted nucleotidyltransferase
MTFRLPVNAGELQDFCQRHRISKLSLFGSTLKGTARLDSDVDLLIEFEPGATPGMMRLSEMEAELSSLLGGRRVDLRTYRDLSRHFRDDVVRTAEVQYARG